ncbi:hypothetical protein THOM_1421, partial [Trachipleistophora hominis]
VRLFMLYHININAHKFFLFSIRVAPTMAYKAAIQLPPELTRKDIPKNLRNNEIFSCKNKTYICVEMPIKDLYCCGIENETTTQLPTEVHSFFWIREA